MKKLIISTILFILFFSMCSAQNKLSINDGINRYEELVMKYSFYKNYIIENNLPIEEYIDIFDSLIEEIDINIIYFENLMNSNIKIENYQIEKIKLLNNIVININNELKTIIKK